MRWLVVGTQSLSPAVAEALVRHGHTAVTPEAGGIAADIEPRDLLIAAHGKQLEVITNDPDLANTPFLPNVNLKFIRTLVFLQLAGEAVEQDDAVDRLFARYKRLSPGRMYTVTETRVKVRQIPAAR